jgi:predicted CoA-binding protein
MGLEWKRNGGSIKKTEKVNNNNYKILPVNYKITTTRIPLLYLEEVDEEIKALNFMGHYHTVPLFEKDLIKIRRGEFGNLI